MLPWLGNARALSMLLGNDEWQCEQLCTILPCVFWFRRRRRWFPVSIDKQIHVRNAAIGNIIIIINTEREQQQQQQQQAKQHTGAAF